MYVYLSHFAAQQRLAQQGKINDMSTKKKKNEKKKIQESKVRSESGQAC